MFFFAGNNKLKQKKYRLPEDCLFPISIPDNRLVSLEYDQRTERRKFVVRQFNGRQLWETQLEQECRNLVHTEETIWLTGEDSLFFSHDCGRNFKRFPLPLKEHEKVDILRIYEDSLIVCLHHPHDRGDTILCPRVLRLPPSGEEIWSAELPIGPISYSGIQCMSVENDWKLMEKPPWNPENFSTNLTDPVLFSDPYTLITYQDQRSGIGIRYVLDFDTGDLIWVSYPGPQGHACALPEGRFIMGSQGYGAYHSQLFDNGSLKTKWDSHGITFLSDSGRLISIQLTNDMSIPQQLVELEKDGSVIQISEKLPGYHTTDVIQLSDELSDQFFYFWRGGRLWRWNPLWGLTPLNRVGHKRDSYGTLQKIDERRLGLYMTTRLPGKIKPTREWIVFQT